MGVRFTALLASFGQQGVDARYYEAYESINCVVLAYHARTQVVQSSFNSSSVILAFQFILVDFV